MSDPDTIFDEAENFVAPLEFDFALTRRRFVQALGAGLLITVLQPVVSAQGRGQRGGRGGRGTIAARLHVGKDGITVLTGKVEGGQGARTELIMAAAEELRVPPAQVKLLMADTSLVPDDGSTAGSRTTPATVPAVRQGAAAARGALANLAAQRWKVAVNELEIRDGTVRHAASQKQLTYVELAEAPEAADALKGGVPNDVALTPIEQWKVMGQSLARPNSRDLVTGAHKYPSDITRPGMLHGKVLRQPSYGARLTAIDLAPARAMKGVIAVQDGSFVGVVAPSTFAAEQALEAIAATAKWEAAPHVDSARLYEHLRQKARIGANPFADELARGAKTLKQTYNVAYVQHAPMECRAAVAEWQDGGLTVWTSTQNPFGVRGELARALRLAEGRVRVIIPDFGGGFGGKHTGECAVEAARLAQAAQKPVQLRWTRAEEFTWAYFRPAAVIDVQASLDAAGAMTSWYFVNVNSGGAAMETPYRVGKARSQYVQSEPPLRHGSYRTLAATANIFARESAMDELAHAAGRDPLEFRLTHLDNPRLRAVLEEAAKRFDWANRVKQRNPQIGVGLACGTEKGSYVAGCVEIAVEKGQISVRKMTEVFECGGIINPDNLLAQVQGAIIMGMGPALREEMQFEDGKMLNPTFRRYLTPRFEDMPELDIHLLNRPDLTPVGGGETPIVPIAPAIANAVFHATGQRIRQMPIKLPNG